MRVIKALGVTAVPLLLAMQAEVQAADLVINGIACGEYTAADFQSNGKLVLSANLLSSCQLGGTPVEPEVPVPPPGKDDEDETTSPPGNPDVPAVCGVNAPIENRVQLWSEGLHSGSLSAKVTGTEDYVIKIDSSSLKKGGYGTLDTFEVAGNSSSRVVALSECPGDFSKHVPSKGQCISEGMSSGLRWAHEGTIARDTFCTLSPTKTYYLNVRHASRNDMQTSTCKDARGNDMQCAFYPSYKVIKNYDK